MMDLGGQQHFHAPEMGLTPVKATEGLVEAGLTIRYSNVRGLSLALVDTSITFSKAQ